MNPAVLVIIITGVAFVAACGYLVTRRDLGQRRAALVAAGSAVVVGVAFLFILYLAVLAYIVAAVAYLLIRRWRRTGYALAVSGTILGGLLAASSVAMAYALEYM